MNILNRLLKGKKGQSTVEFALILPVLILILTGILEFGIMLNDYLSISHASRDGARYASLGETDTVVTATVHNLLPRIDSSKITITISPSYASRTRGDAVTVEVNYNYDVTLPIMSNILGSNIYLKAETTMRVE